MKFSCDKNELNKALQDTARAVPSHAATEILKGVLVEAREGEIFLTGNNMELAIVTRFPALIERPGIYVLECRMLLDIVRKLPDETVFFEVDDSFNVMITCGLSSFDLLAIPHDNFPPVPPVKGMKSIRMKQSVLEKQLDQTLFSVSQNETNIIHTGVLFDAEPGLLTLVALDGHRLALRRESIDFEDRISFVVPGNSLKELQRMLSRDEEEFIDIHVGMKHILFEFEGVTVVARLLEGEFLKYRNSVPVEFENIISVDLMELLGCVERVSLLINEKLKNPLKMSFKNDKIILSTISSVGKGEDLCSCECESEFEIGFNHRYILDALNHLDGDRIMLKCSGPLSPCVITSCEDENAVFMVLPLRLKSE